MDRNVCNDNDFHVGLYIFIRFYAKLVRKIKIRNDRLSLNTKIERISQSWLVLFEYLRGVKMMSRNIDNVEKVCFKILSQNS